MRAVAATLLVGMVCSVTVSAQTSDRFIERMSLALQQPPSPTLTRIGPAEGSTAPKTFGIFTLVQPELRGEMIRVSVPIGELVSRAFKGTASAHRRRQEAAARREVLAALAAFTAQQAAATR